jgi:hypothetical protein
MQSGLDQMLRSVRRRWIGWRCLERAGLCALASCAVAGLLAGVLIYRGEAAMGLIAIILAAGFLCGALLAWGGRPTLLETAVEIDRQLRLHDLLATAVSLEQSRLAQHDQLDEQWHRTVLAHASQRITNIRANELVLHRLGARAWGGIGLSTGLVLTIGLISANPLVSQARHPEAAARPTLQPLPSAGDEPASQSPAAATSPPDAQHAETRDLASQKLAQRTDETGAHEEGDGRDATSGGEATGLGAARTTFTPARTTLPIAPAGARPDAAGAGTPAGGAGVAVEPSTSAEHSGTGITTSRDGESAPPAAVDGSRASSPHDIDLSAAPEGYRDLIRDYFTRD